MKHKLNCFYLIHIILITLNSSDGNFDDTLEDALIEDENKQNNQLIDEELIARENQYFLTPKQHYFPYLGSLYYTRFYPTFKHIPQVRPHSQRYINRKPNQRAIKYNTIKIYQSIHEQKKSKLKKQEIVLKPNPILKKKKIKSCETTTKTPVLKFGYQVIPPIECETIEEQNEKFNEILPDMKPLPIVEECEQKPCQQKTKIKSTKIPIIIQIKTTPKTTNTSTTKKILITSEGPTFGSSTELKTTFSCGVLGLGLYKSSYETVMKNNKDFVKICLKEPEIREAMSKMINKIYIKPDFDFNDIEREYEKIQKPVIHLDLPKDMIFDDLDNIISDEEMATTFMATETTTELSAEILDLEKTESTTTPDSLLSTTEKGEDNDRTTEQTISIVSTTLSTGLKSTPESLKIEPEEEETEASGESMTEEIPDLELDTEKESNTTTIGPTHGSHIRFLDLNFDTTEGNLDIDKTSSPENNCKKIEEEYKRCLNETFGNIDRFIGRVTKTSDFIRENNFKEKVYRHDEYVTEKHENPKEKVFRHDEYVTEETGSHGNPNEKVFRHDEYIDISTTEESVNKCKNLEESYKKCFAMTTKSPKKMSQTSTSTVESLMSLPDNEQMNGFNEDLKSTISSGEITQTESTTDSDTEDCKKYEKFYKICSNISIDHNIRDEMIRELINDSKTENRAFRRHDCDEIRAKFDKCVTITTTTTTEESESSSESSVEDIVEEITITSNTKNIDIDDCKHTKRVYELCFNSSIHHKILDKNIRGIIDVSKNNPIGLQRHDCEEIKAKYNKCFRKTTIGFSKTENNTMDATNDEILRVENFETTELMSKLSKDSKTDNKFTNSCEILEKEMSEEKYEELKTIKNLRKTGKYVETQLKLIQNMNNRSVGTEDIDNLYKVSFALLKQLKLMAKEEKVKFKNRKELKNKIKSCKSGLSKNFEKCTKAVNECHKRTTKWEKFEVMEKFEKCKIAVNECHKKWTKWEKFEVIENQEICVDKCLKSLPKNNVKDMFEKDSEFQMSKTFLNRNKRSIKNKRFKRNVNFVETMDSLYKSNSNKEPQSLESRIDRNEVLDEIKYSFNGQKQRIYTSPLEPFIEGLGQKLGELEIGLDENEKRENYENFRRNKSWNRFGNNNDGSDEESEEYSRGEDNSRRDSDFDERKSSDILLPQNEEKSTNDEDSILKIEKPIENLFEEITMPLNLLITTTENIMTTENIKSTKAELSTTSKIARETTESDSNSKNTILYRDLTTLNLDSTTEILNENSETESAESSNKSKDSSLLTELLTLSLNSDSPTEQINSEKQKNSERIKTTPKKEYNTFVDSITQISTNFSEHHIKNNSDSEGRTEITHDNILENSGYLIDSTTEDNSQNHVIDSTTESIVIDSKEYSDIKSKESLFNLSESSTDYSTESLVTEYSTGYFSETTVENSEKKFTPNLDSLKNKKLNSLKEFTENDVSAENVTENNDLKIGKESESTTGDPNGHELEENSGNHDMGFEFKEIEFEEFSTKVYTTESKIFFVNSMNENISTTERITSSETELFSTESFVSSSTLKEEITENHSEFREFLYENRTESTTESEGNAILKKDLSEVYYTDGEKPSDSKTDLSSDRISDDGRNGYLITTTTSTEHCDTFKIEDIESIDSSFTTEYSGKISLFPDSDTQTETEIKELKSNNREKTSSEFRKILFKNSFNIRSDDLNEKMTEIDLGSDEMKSLKGLNSVHNEIEDFDNETHHYSQHSEYELLKSDHRNKLLASPIELADWHIEQISNDSFSTEGSSIQLTNNTFNLNTSSAHEMKITSTEYSIVSKQTLKLNVDFGSKIKRTTEYTTTAQISEDLIEKLSPFVESEQENILKNSFDEELDTSYLNITTTTGYSEETITIPESLRQNIKNKTKFTTTQKSQTKQSNSEKPSNNNRIPQKISIESAKTPIKNISNGRIKNFSAHRFDERKKSVVNYGLRGENGGEFHLKFINKPTIIRSKNQYVMDLNRNRRRNRNHIINDGMEFDARHDYNHREGLHIRRRNRYQNKRRNDYSSAYYNRQYIQNSNEMRRKHLSQRKGFRFRLRNKFSEDFGRRLAKNRYSGERERFADFEGSRRLNDDKLHSDSYGRIRPSLKSIRRKNMRNNHRKVYISEEIDGILTEYDEDLSDSDE